MTQDEAIAKAESAWWRGLSDRDIVAFQLYERRLCMPFGEFHRALEGALGRPVFTHELALNEMLQAEFEGKQEPLDPMDSLRDAGSGRQNHRGDTVTDLPQYATPWTKDGVTRCVVPTALNATTGMVAVMQKEGARWVTGLSYMDPTILHPDLLAGLGREVPPIPKPKTRATAVPVADDPPFEYAARVIPRSDKVLYCRQGSGYRVAWTRSTGPTTEQEVLAAVRAFALAGELLPGESE